MKLLPVERFGETVQGIRLRGDPRSPEPESVRVRFPGGDVDVIRCDDGGYWVHVRVDSEQDVREERAEVAGRVVDVRVDYRRERGAALAASHVEAQMQPIDIVKPGPYHLAVRIRR